MKIQHDLYGEIEPYLDKPEAIVITGMRRTGKTTLLRFIYEKIGQDNKLFLDLENTLHRKYFEEEDYERIRFNLEVLGVDFKNKASLFLDGIQLCGVFRRHVFYSSHQTIQQEHGCGNKEIDFIVNRKEAYEVKIHASEQDVNFLEKVSKELKIKHYKLVSRAYTNLEHTSYGFNLI